MPIRVNVTTWIRTDSGRAGWLWSLRRPSPATLGKSWSLWRKTMGAAWVDRTTLELAIRSYSPMEFTTHASRCLLQGVPGGRSKRSTTSLMKSISNWVGAIVPSPQRHMGGWRRLKNHTGAHRGSLLLLHPTVQDLVRVIQ